MRILPLKRDERHHRITGYPGIKLAEPLLILQGCKNGLPVLLHRLTGLVLEIQQQLDVDIENPRVGLRPFNVAAQPETRVRNSAQHDTSSWSRTHVSLLPPPCEEFTTSDPFRMATLVSPPGMITVFSPDRIYGRKSMCRPSIRPSQ